MTFGVTIAIAPIITAIWPGDSLNLGDPWALDVLRFAGIGITARDAALIPITAVLLLAFFLFFRYTRIGLSLRATAIDSEAAMAQGISTRFVFGVSWGVAGALGPSAASCSPRRSAGACDPASRSTRSSPFPSSSSAASSPPSVRSSAA